MLICSKYTDNRFFLFVVLTLFLSVSGSFLIAQTDKEIITRADRFFQQEKYPEAMQLYSQLLSLHRNDPLYSYRFGVSMLYSDRLDPDAAIRYIEAGINKLLGDDAVLIYFHLATAYHLNFRFIEALRYYETFRDKSTARKFELYNVNQRIDMCYNGVKLLKNIRDLYVFEKHHVSVENFFRSYNVSRFGGKFLIKPDIFKTRFDKKIGESSIVFLSDTQQVVYYSSYGKDGKNGKDIYRSYKRGDGTWGEPERLSNLVNTGYDEDYPFILPDDNTLYFSSKGHNSMGGYDVFKTTWDEYEQQWTTPVNLDFAINTPYDDILFVTDRDEKFAYFSSVRNSGLKKINVYMVRIDVRPEKKPEKLIAQVTNLSARVDDSTYLNAVRQIQQISNLQVNTTGDELDKFEQERRRRLYADNYKYNISDNPTEDELITLTFNFAEDASNTFGQLRQKRQAAELSADRYRDRMKKFASETQSIEMQAAAETDPVVSKQLSEQSAFLNRKAVESEMQYLQALQLSGQLTQAINLQRIEYDKIIIRAGDIQKLASANQIDTSVVLLKRLIDDIRTYEINVDKQITQIFDQVSESQEPFTVDAAFNQYDIQAIDKSIELLENEKAKLVNSLKNVNDPSLEGVLQEEIMYLELEIEKQQKMKSESSDQQYFAEHINNFVAEDVRNSGTQVLNDIATIEKFIENRSDSLDYFIQNEDITLSDVYKPDAYFSENRTSDLYSVNEPIRVKSADTVRTTELITSFEGTATQIDVQTAVLTESSVADLVGVDTVSVRKDDVTKSETKVSSSEMKKFSGMTSSEKLHYLEEIIQKDQPPAIMANEIVNVFEEEKALIFIRKRQLEKEIAQIIGRIENTEHILTGLNSQLSDPGLNSFDRRMLESSWERQMLNYRNDLQELEMKKIILEHTNDVLSDVERIDERVFDMARQVSRSAEAGNQKKSEADVNKLISYVQKNQEVVFSDDARFRYSVNKYTEQLNADAMKWQGLAERAEMESENYITLSQKVALQAAKTNNTSKKNKLLNDQKQFDLLAETMSDSAMTYKEFETNVRQHTEAIRKSESEIAARLSEVQKTSVQLFENDQIPLITTIPAEKLKRMNALISQNVYSDQFSSAVSDANQWTSAPVSEKIPDRIFQEAKSESEVYGMIQKIESSDDADEVQQIADTEHLYILRASATFLVTAISQLEDEAGTITDPEVLSLTSENIDVLKEELRHTVRQYNSIAQKYAETEPLTVQNLPDAGDISYQPEIALAATRKYIEFLEYEIKKYTTALNRSSSEQSRQQLREMIRMKEEILAEYTLRVVEIVAVAERNKSLATSIVLKSIPLPGVDKLTLQKINDLKTAGNQYEKIALRKFKDAEAITDLEQKKIMYIERFDAYAKALQFQDELFILYSEKAAADFDAAAVLRRNLKFAVGDMSRIASYFRETERDQPVDETAEHTTAILNQSVSENIIRPENFETGNQAEPVRNTTFESNQTIPADVSAQTASPEKSVIVSDRASSEFVQFYSDVNPVPEHNPNEWKLLFRVQFSASKMPARNDEYAGMMPIFYEYAEGWYRYMHGEFFDLNNAFSARNQIRTMGYADAFVVAYFNGRRISVAEARNILAQQPELSRGQSVDMSAVEQGAQLAVSSGTQVSFAEMPAFYYAVQIGVYGSMRTSDRLFGISPLIEERLANGNYRYMTGIYATLAEANAARDLIRENGIPDAYVVIYRNGQRISAHDAQNFIDVGEKPIVQEFNRKFGTEPKIAEVKSVRAENVFFKVQLGAYRNQVPVEVVNAFIELADDGIQIITDAQGLTIYLAGKCKTPAEAEILKNKVHVGGIPDAFIVAVEGDKKITLQEAKEKLGIR